MTYLERKNLVLAWIDHYIRFMRNRLLAVGCLFAVLLFALALPAEAKSHKKHANLHGVVVTEVDVAEKSIVITIESSKSSLKYSLPTGATITVDESPADLGKIKKGMHVVSYTEADEHILSQIDVKSSKG